QRCTRGGQRGRRLRGARHAHAADCRARPGRSGQRAYVTFKAIQLDPVTRQRTGRELALGAETRQAAVDELLALLQVTVGDVRIDPTRTLVQLPTELWTIVGGSLLPPTTDPVCLRPAGAKHSLVLSLSFRPL